VNFSRLVAESGEAGLIGVYGCAADGAGRVVRVAWAGEGKPPLGVELDCPACGELHHVGLSWRKATDLDLDRPLDLTLGSDDVDAAGEAADLLTANDAATLSGAIKATRREQQLAAVEGPELELTSAPAPARPRGRGRPAAAARRRGRGRPTGGKSRGRG
jgi:hypothetical protein